MPDARHPVSRRTGLPFLAAWAIVITTACQAAAPASESAAVSVAPSPERSAASVETPIASTLAEPSSPKPSPGSSSFPFSADAVAGFYETQGLACAAAIPSTIAAGWQVRTCAGTDSNGRPITVGLMADDAGSLGAGFASVTALPAEEFLESTDALDHTSGFLGAMLGENVATDQLPWLAGHLGDEYAETSVDDVTIATYTESPDDPTRIYVEVAGPEYLAAEPP
jgi:hypothetical protein